MANIKIERGNYHIIREVELELLHIKEGEATISMKVKYCREDDVGNKYAILHTEVHDSITLLLGDKLIFNIRKKEDGKNH